MTEAAGRVARRCGLHDAGELRRGSAGGPLRSLRWEDEDAGEVAPSRCSRGWACTGPGTQRGAGRGTRPRRAAGQDYKSVNLYAGTGVAVREMVTDAGPADYVLFVNRQAVGVIEAKKKGMTLSGVEWQTVKYQVNVPEALPRT